MDERLVYDRRRTAEHPKSDSAGFDSVKLQVSGSRLAGDVVLQAANRDTQRDEGFALDSPIAGPSRILA